VSSKLVPFESLGAVSYSPSIVTLAVSVAVYEILSVKEWRDLENQVNGRLRSLKMAPFDRPHVTFYSSSSRMRVIYHNWSATKQRPHPQSVAEISHHFYWSAIVNIALSCTIFELFDVE